MNIKIDIYIYKYINIIYILLYFKFFIIII